MFDIDALRGCTYATIRAAFNNSDEIMEEYGDMGSANITGIMTKVMQDVGRFSERWSSDALYNLDHLRDIAGRAARIEEPFDEIFAFGIRADGVDGNTFLVQRIADTRDYMTGYVFPLRTYRRILAVRATACREKGLSSVRARFSLRDLTHAFHSIDTADLQDPGDKMSKLRDVPFEGGKSPEPYDEKARVDKVYIQKLKEEGYKSFGSREIGELELAKDGCFGNIRCIEVDGFWDPAVPAPRHPSDCAVCRVYLASGKDIIIAWLTDWYQACDGVLREIEKAKAALLGAAAGDGKEAADGTD